MITIDQISIKADPDAVYQAAADIERWPRTLPHYRWVRIIGESEDGRVVEMAAHRDGIPVKWRAIQTLDPAKRRVYYRHIKGATKGMWVEWSMESTGDTTIVRLVHELTLDTPIVNSPPGKWIVGKVFVRRIAGQTLSRLKLLLETERMDTCGEQ